MKIVVEMDYYRATKNCYVYRVRTGQGELWIQDRIYLSKDLFPLNQPTESITITATDE